MQSCNLEYVILAMTVAETGSLGVVVGLPCDAAFHGKLNHN